MAEIKKDKILSESLKAMNYMMVRDYGKVGNLDDLNELGVGYSDGEADGSHIYGPFMIIPCAWGKFILKGDNKDVIKVRTYDAQLKKWNDWRKI